MNLTDSIRAVEPEMWDIPHFRRPKEIGKGRLTETRGEDKFLTSLAARSRSGDVLHLKTVSWSVPWTLTLDAGYTGSGLPEGLDNKAGSAPGQLAGPTAGELGNLPGARIDAYMSDRTADED